MRYEIPVESIEILEKGVPHIKYVGNLSPDLKTFVVAPNKLSEFKSNFETLNRLVNVNFGYTLFLDWVAQYSKYPFKIYSMLSNVSGSKNTDDKYQIPYSVDFRSQLKLKLQKKLGPKVKGVPSYTEYYEIKRPVLDSNGDNIFLSDGNIQFEYINKVARIDFSLTYDTFGFIVKREEKLKWYREDDQLSSAFKDIGRSFDPVLDSEARIKEGKLRRSSIIDGLQIPILTYLRQLFPSKLTSEILILGRNFMTKHEASFSDFINKALTVEDPLHIDFGKRVAWVIIRDYSDAIDNIWLDGDLGSGKTIRQIILDELAI